MNNYKPRQYIVDNYGPINSGRVLKKFLFDNFDGKIQKLNSDDTLTLLKPEDVDYIVFRGPLTGFIPENKEELSNKIEEIGIKEIKLNNLSVYKL